MYSGKTLVVSPSSEVGAAVSYAGMREYRPFFFFTRRSDRALCRLRDGSGLACHDGASESLQRKIKRTNKKLFCRPSRRARDITKRQRYFSVAKRSSPPTIVRVVAPPTAAYYRAPLSKRQTALRNTCETPTLRVRFDYDTHLCDYLLSTLLYRLYMHRDCRYFIVYRAPRTCRGGNPSNDPTSVVTILK